MTREDVAAVNEEAMMIDGVEFDVALIGVSSTGRAVYSIDAIIDVLVQSGMDDEEANEWFGFNIESCYLGDYMPIYVQVGIEEV